MRFICVTDTVVAAWIKLVCSHFMNYCMISSRTCSDNGGGIVVDFQLLEQSCGENALEFA